VETFADPAVIRGNDGFYYAYATTDPLHSNDRDSSGNFIFHKVPMARSSDLVNWTYIGDAFSTNPPWLEPTSGIWAPDIRFFNGQYYLYYTATDVTDAVSGEPGCGGDSAIGVATSPNPYGPWTDSGQPVVYPRRAGPGCNFFWTFDPAALEDELGNKYIFFGSYYGGVFGRRLSPDGLVSDPATQVQIAIANRYEGTYIVRHEGFYYFFGSATDCCRGPLTGYSVFTGRSATPLGTYVDRSGVPLTDGRVGGSVVISMNGNRWVGPGHNAVITDEAGQDWFYYHAIDRNDPYLGDPNPQNINKRPMLADRLSWIDGWPSVRSGYWASDEPQPAPITEPGQTPQPTPQPRPTDVPGTLLEGPSDEFNGTPEPQWAWVRQPPPERYSSTEHPGFFRFRTGDEDLFEDNNSAAVLLEDAPAGDFLVETKFEFNLPPEGCCFNYRQAGMVLYENDDAYVKVVHASIWETRQTEWAKEVPPPPPARPRRYGNTVIGPPGDPNDAVITTTTWLRIVKRTDTATGEQHYTAYSSWDGLLWERGGTWTHNLSNIKIGLVSMGGAGSIADFDYVRVYTLAPNATATSTAAPSSTSTLVPTGTATVATSTGTATVTRTGTATVTRTGTAVTTATSSATSTALATSTGTSTAVATRTSTGTATRVVTMTGTPVRTATPCHGKVTICHRTGNGGWHTIRVSCNALPAHLRHGDRVGVCATPTPRSGRNGFGDVTPSDYFYDPVLDLHDAGAISGYSDNTFRPYNNTTRSQFVKLTALAFHLPLYEGTEQHFSDVPRDHPFYVFVETARMHGLVSGYNDGTFRPYNNVTRGQVAKVAVEAARLQDLSTGTPTFADVSADHPFYAYIETAYANGILVGYADGTFRPNANATRGQLSKIIDIATHPEE
jgi:arabinan endo-1,5-alpha-L-arabinosidase